MSAKQGPAKPKAKGGRPPDAAPQANEGGTARPESDQAAGRGAPLTWNRSEEVAKFVPHPRHTAEELKLFPTVQAVLEQLSVLQACTESLLTAVGKKSAALTIADNHFKEAAPPEGVEPTTLREKKRKEEETRAEDKAHGRDVGKTGPSHTKGEARCGRAQRHSHEICP